MNVGTCEMVSFSLEVRMESLWEVLLLLIFLFGLGVAISRSDIFSPTSHEVFMGGGPPTSPFRI